MRWFSLVLLLAASLVGACRHPCDRLLDKLCDCPQARAKSACIEAKTRRDARDKEVRDKARCEVEVDKLRCEQFN